ncbi:hypothetical protein AAFF_G00423270 [Aldrovandia affinis]|uniref:Uncharacterized protein n=1 Tax=Aldrovandia affinis TaxID=143900 RepID=A0AAD7WZW1_9TELE|nr:hypothetical protein AAFF_G00423270 [Aldrovandia affinis]
MTQRCIRRSQHAEHPAADELTCTSQSLRPGVLIRRDGCDGRPAPNLPYLPLTVRHQAEAEDRPNQTRKALARLHSRGCAHEAALVRRIAQLGQLMQRSCSMHLNDGTVH